MPKQVAAAFDFRELNLKTGLLERVTAEKRQEIGRLLSPITHVAKGAAPTLIIHGDLDKVVPIAQSESMIKELKGCGVTCQLLVMEGKGHFEFKWVVGELPKLADWFDLQLRGKK